jgi:transcriptional regulator with XRE-family HTH domain
MKESFGAFIARRRMERGLGLRELAADLGIGAPYLCDMEKDRRWPPDEPLLGRMAERLALDGEMRARLYDLAGECRGEVPADVSPYVRDNDVVRMALRRASSAGAGEAEWLRFIRQLEGKE